MTKLKRTSGAAVGLDLLVRYLRSDTGKAHLAKVPEFVRWARSLAATPQKYPDAIDVTAAETSGEASSPTAPVDPRPRRRQVVDRLGHRGLVRRVAGVRAALERAFPDPGTRPAPFAGLDELDRALAIAETLPTVKRLRVHQRVDRQLDRLESALVAAALPRRSR